MALNLATLLLVALYSYLCYLNGNSILIVQASIVSVATLLLSALWSPENSNQLYQASSRKNANTGWYCSMLLMPILVLAHGGGKVLELHTLTVIQSLAQAIIASYQNIPLCSLLTAGLGYILTQTNSGLQMPVLIKTMVSSISLHGALLVGMKSTFTMGESAFLAQLVVLVKFLWSAVEWSLLEKVSYLFIFAIGLAVIFSTSLANIIPTIRSPFILPLALVASSFVSLKFLNFDLAEVQSALTDLLKSEGANFVLILWVSGLAVVSAMTWYFHTYEIEEDEQYILQIFRKSYHIAALAMFLPAGFYNLDLLKLGLVLAACLFISIETVRILAPGSWTGNCLNRFFRKFLTVEESENSIPIPHCFLLFGCALPVMISTVPNSIHAYSGMFALCVTDASAAIAGSLTGQHTWPSSKKTIEGTLISMVVTYIFISFISESILFEQAVPELPAILTYSTLLPVWEAVCDQNDNLTLPVVAYAISRLLF